MDRLTELAGGIGTLLTARGATVAVAESSAGGLVSAALLAVPGASAYYAGGGVIYTRASRRVLLGLPEEIVTMRAATEDYALIVARAVRDRLDATWGLCETGAAGPTGNRLAMPPGTPVSPWPGRSRGRSRWKPAAPSAAPICGASRPPPSSC